MAVLDGVLGILALGGLLERLGLGLDVGLLLVAGLVAMVLEGLVDRVDELFGLVARLDEILAGLSSSSGVRLRVLAHLFDLGVA